MSSFSRIAVAAGLCGAFTFGALGTSPAGAATVDHVAPHIVKPNFVNTTRVVGFPQHARVSTSEHAGGLGKGVGSRTAPAITLEPTSETVSTGTTASFTASASGNPTPSVQWYKSTNGGSRWSAIAGATSDTLSFTATASENGYEFEATFHNSAGSATTTTAALTVTSTQVAPTITTEPQNVSVASGSTATFSAAASGTPTPTVQWYESINSGVTFSTISGATADGYSFTATANETGDEFYAIFHNTVGSAQTNTVTLTVTSALVESSNWSGYADQGTEGTFSAVSGSWNVPTLSCTSRTTSYSAEWIGIDGYSSSTVEQTGSEADCINGTPSYDAWYEMYGDSAVNDGYEVELSTSTNPVSPGDQMTASVSDSAGVWTISITDNTKGWTSPVVIDYSGAQQSSAEWIVERPEICSFSCSLASLANFGTVSFTGADASSSGGAKPISSYIYSGMEMVNGGTRLAEPSALNSSGNGFTDTWYAA